MPFDPDYAKWDSELSAVLLTVNHPIIRLVVKTMVDMHRLEGNVLV
jgi:hypothetical protein